MRVGIPSAMRVVSRVNGQPSHCVALTPEIGLYYKLHGVHRPVTMKKSVIKRRRRVIPTADTPPLDDGSATETTASPPPGADMAGERGSVNADGSVNLGFRHQPEPSMSLVPESLLRQNRQPSPLPSGDLKQYVSSHTHHSHDLPDSLTDDNRLAPLTSLEIPADRQSSLSPASFLSPSRKRSFSSTERDFANASEQGESSKRLSSIKSILNAASTAGARPELAHRYSPPGSAGPDAVGGPPRDLERAKAEKRAALQREAERMRELLAAKERELAEMD